MPPFSMVTDTHVFHELLGGGAFDNRDGQSLDSGRCGYSASVTVGLFAVVVILLNKHITATVDGGEETDWRQICRA